MASVSIDDVRDVINISTADIPDTKILKMLGEIVEERQIFVATQDPEFEQCLEKSLNKAKTRIYELQEWGSKGLKISL